MADKDDIITIDGPSGSGKSSLSRFLAEALGYTYLDTGAMYRAVGLKVDRQGIDPDDAEQLARVLDDIEISLEPGDDDTRVLLDGKDVSLAIRAPEMAMVASKVSAYPAVRTKLTQLQRELGKRGKIVAEGRDMGTVVFTGARHKFFFDATAEERARRRTLQHEEKGTAADYEEILAQIKKRDHDDSTRSVAPLKPASDATIVDTSKMSIDEVLQFLLDQIKKGEGELP